MIEASQLRLGNFILHKSLGRIRMVSCTFEHFALLSKNDKDLFGVVLKPELLLRAGFIENKNYPLLPGAREFSILLPVIGAGQNQIFAWVKANGECFGRATVTGLPVSNNFHYLHELQNLYYALTSEELLMRP